MKKLKVLSLVAAATVGMGLLTSCMDGNTTSTGTIYGVLDHSPKNFKKVIKGTDGGVYYASTIENDSNFPEGECVIVYGTIDYSSPENANASAYGYYTMTAQSYGKFDKYDGQYLIEEDTASTSIRKGEMSFGNVGAIVGGYYINNYIFINVQSPAVQADQKTRFKVSFDPVVKTDQGKRVYDLYLRAQKTQDGKESTQGNGFIVPVKMDYFISQATSQEQAEGAQSINVRLNYMSEFNKDTTSAVWAKSLIFALPLEEKK